jgi:predicted lysophospholipase L1 biosynthesis ABC-type transport system permease subunit
MNFVQCIVAVLLISLSLLIAIGQWWSIYSIPKKLNVQGQPRNYSMIPLFGGLLGAIGCLVATSSVVRQLWWVPLLIDPGCALLFGILAISGLIAVFKRVLGRHSD